MPNDVAVVTPDSPKSPRVPIGSQWVIRDGRKDTYGRPVHYRAEVVDGDSETFHLADGRLGCLCTGIPGSLTVANGIHYGVNWIVRLLHLARDGSYGLFLVENRTPVD